MKKLTIDFDVKGCDLILNVYEKGKLDEAECRKIFESGDDYINALGGIAQHKDYEFTYADMECCKLNIELDEVVVKTEEQSGQYEIHDAGFEIYYDNSCFNDITCSFKNHDRWKMLCAIKNPEQDVALIMERYKGLYRHSYSWNIESDKFDFEKLSFHYGRALSNWDAITAQGDEYYPDSLLDGADDEAALLTVTYGDEVPDEWRIEPPWGDIHPSMMILDCSLIEQMVMSERP